MLKKEPDETIGTRFGALLGELCHEYEERVVVECMLDAAAWLEAEISDQPRPRYKDLSERLMEVLGDFRIETVEELN